MIEFMKQSPADVEGFERTLISDYLIEVGKINLHNERRWSARGISLPPAWNYSSKCQISAMTRVFNYHNVAALDCVAYKFPSALGTTNRRAASLAQYSRSIKLQIRKPGNLSQLSG
jgi:hypothetical protein